MKLSLKSTINTTSPLFALFEENKYVYPIGRNLCIKTLAQDIYQFIPLCESMDQVLDLGPTSNRKHFVVLEVLSNKELHLAIYSAKTGERRSMKLTSQTIRKATVLETGDASFSTVWMQLADDQHHIVQVDLPKLKIVASAFSSDLLVSVQNNPTNDSMVSMATRNTLKLFEAKDGGLELTSQLVRKLASTKELTGHIWFDNDILIVWTTNELFVVGSTNNELLQTITVHCAANEEITHLKRLTRCLVLTTTLGRCLMYLRTEERFVLYQDCNLPQPISPIALEINSNEDFVVVRMPDLSFVVSKVDDISEERINGQYKPALSFELNDNFIGELTQRGVSICQTKPLILFTQAKHNSIGVWNIETYKCVIRKHFTAKYKEDNANILTAGVMHPNGYSIALAFLDRIRFYHLLLDDIKCFYELPSKRVKTLRYSHGGQFLCYSYGKGKGTFISVISTINMQEICQLKVGSDVEQIIWSENDYELICACQGYISKWSLVDSFANREDIEVSETINLMRFDFKTNKLLVSTKNSILEIENSTNFRRVPVPIPNFHFAYPLDGKYIFGDAEGYLHVAQTLECEKAERLAVGTSRSFLYSKSGTLIHLTPETSEVFIIRTKAGVETKTVKEQYILVARSELERNIDRVHSLENNIETYHSELMMRLSEQKSKMEELRRHQLEQFKREMASAKNNETSLLVQKTQLEKMSAQLFDTVENCQMRAVDQLEKLYESKLLIERNRVLNLEQKVLEDRMVFQQNLKQLEERHHHEIEVIRQRYEDSFKGAFKEIGVNKHKELELRKQLETALMEVQEQNEHMLVGIQLDAESETKQLLSKISAIEKNFDTAKADNKNLTEKKQELTRKYDIQSEQFKRTQNKLEEARNRITLLQKQLANRDELVREKETKLYQYEFKINDLEKSKHVLSFRTTEIRKELQPKESQIDKLKRQLFKLEEEFKQAMKDNYNCEQKLERAQKNNENTKKELGEVRAKLKKKTVLHQQLTQDIYKLVNNLDPKEWNPRIVQIYQQYVGAMAQEQSKKKPNENTTEELNRHLIHLEKSLHQVGVSNDRSLKGCEKDVVRKLKENAELISDLNDLRKRERQYRTELEAKNNEIVKLQRELNDAARSSTLRIDSAVTGITGARRTAKQHDSLDTSFRGGILDHRKSQYTAVTAQPSSQQVIVGSRRSNRILSANRTAVCRGSNFDPNSVSMLERNKLYEVLAELEAAQARIRQQDNLIDQLNRKAMVQ